MKSTNRVSKISADRPKPPQTVCPGCDLIRSSWPERGYVYGDLQYCCQDCADGFRCYCGDKHLGAIAS